MLKLTRMVPQTREFDQWFDEVREMMHREVNYHVEAATTRRFAERLKDDERYIVPTIVDEYLTRQPLAAGGGLHPQKRQYRARARRR